MAADVAAARMEPNSASSVIPASMIWIGLEKAKAMLRIQDPEFYEVHEQLREAALAAPLNRAALDRAAQARAQAAKHIMERVSSGSIVIKSNVIYPFAWWR